jgi:hypothetical protein
LFAQEIFLSRPDPLVRRFFGKSPEKTKSCAIIAAIHELSGLASAHSHTRMMPHLRFVSIKLMMAAIFTAIFQKKFFQRPTDLHQASSPVCESSGGWENQNEVDKACKS